MYFSLWLAMYCSVSASQMSLFVVRQDIKCWMRCSCLFPAVVGWYFWPVMQKGNAVLVRATPWCCRLAMPEITAANQSQNAPQNLPRCGTARASHSQECQLAMPELQWHHHITTITSELERRVCVCARLTGVAWGGAPVSYATASLFVPKVGVIKGGLICDNLSTKRLFLWEKRWIYNNCLISQWARFRGGLYSPFHVFKKKAKLETKLARE